MDYMDLCLGILEGLDIQDKETIINCINILRNMLLTGNVNILTYLSICKDIDVYTAGLNMTSEQAPFLIMPQIEAISDEVVSIKASCYDCGRGATYTFYLFDKSDAVRVGDEGYIPLCARCLCKRRGEDKVKKLLLKKEES